MIALTLGLPMVFFAGLLGSFLFETKLNPKRHMSPESQDSDQSNHTEQLSGSNKQK